MEEGFFARRACRVKHPLGCVPQSAYVVGRPWSADSQHTAVGIFVVDARDNEPAEVLACDRVVNSKIPGVVSSSEERYLLPALKYLIENHGIDDVGRIGRWPHTRPLKPIWQAPHQFSFNVKLVELRSKRRLVATSVRAMNEMLDTAFPSCIDNCLGGLVVNVVDALLICNLGRSEEGDAAVGACDLYDLLNCSLICDFPHLKAHTVLYLQLREHTGESFK